MRNRTARLLAIGVAGSLVAGLVVAANAESSVQVALRQKHDLQQRIEELQETRRLRRVGLHQRIRFSQARLRNAPGAAKVGDRARYHRFRQQQVDRIENLRAQERELFRTTRARIRDLRSKRTELSDWIDSLPLQRCPVDGPVTLNDNFGIWHDHGKDGSHVHQGVDMGASTGSRSWPRSTGTRSRTRVSKAATPSRYTVPGGYVYNAHLSAYGKLGAVQGRRRDRLRRHDRQRDGSAPSLRVAPGRRRGGGPLPLPRGGLLRRE